MPKKYAAILILAAILLGSLFTHQARAAKRNYADFHCFYTAGKRMLAGEQIYIANDREAAEFRYAPLIALIISGLALLPEAQADSIWYILNFSLLIAAFACLKEIVAPGRKNNLILYLLAGFGSLRLIFYNLNAGQANILMLAAAVFGLYYFSKGKEGIGGGWLALSVMLKYTPLIFLPFFILRKKPKIAIFMFLFIFIYLLLPAAFIGFKANLTYLKGLGQQLFHSTILDQATLLANKNQSLLSGILRMFSPCAYYFPNAPKMPFEHLWVTEKNLRLIFAASAILLYTLILLPAKRKIRGTPLSYNIDFSLLFICVTFFNLNAWVHTYIFLAMAYFVITDYLLKCNFKDKIVLASWVISATLNNLLTPALLGKPLMDKIYYYSPFTIGGLLVFLALLKIKFSRSSC